MEALDDVELYVMLDRRVLTMKFNYVLKCLVWDSYTHTHAHAHAQTHTLGGRFHKPLSAQWS